MMSTSQVKTSQFNLQPSTKDDSTWLIFDLESDGLYDEATKIYCIVCYDIKTNQIFSYGPDNIHDGLRHLQSANFLIGHNILFYDCPLIQKLHDDYQLKAQIIDTLICTRLLWPKEVLFDLDESQYEKVPPRLKGSASLKAWGYRLGDYKINFEDFSSYSPEMLTYCEQDVHVTHTLWKYIVKQNYPQPALRLEHDFATCINKQIRSGVPFDVDAALDLVDVLSTKRKELEENLKKVFPPIKRSEIFIPKVNNKTRGYVKGVPFEKIHYEEFNPGSRKQIIERLQSKYGWVSKRKTEKGNPILDDKIIEQLPFDEAKPLAEYMLIKKRLGQISEGNNAWLKLVNNETGRLHGDVITNGCITARCSHRSPNLGQVVANDKPYGKECRALFHPPYDWDMLGADAKALELRCLAGYLAIWDKGEYASIVIDPSVDVHEYNQKKFNVATRSISKTLLYAVLYGAGHEKAGTTIDSKEKDKRKLELMGKTAIDSFYKGIPALKTLKDGIEEAVTTRGYLIGLDKRALYCRSGFKALNVLLQSAGALLMKQVVINLHNNIENNLKLEHGKDWVQLLMIHDEVQLACKPKHTEAIRKEVLKSFPQAQEFFGFRCKIEGDSKIGTNWSETH
jgi:DNA polymerase-1